MILSLPTDYQKSLQKINNNYITIFGCAVEVLPDGRYKAFDKVCANAFEAAKYVRVWKAKHKHIMQVV